MPPSRFNPDIPAAMDQVILKALAPAPADRYPDVKAFLLALGAVKLAPAKESAQPGISDQSCPRCGAENQTGRYCRRCGTSLSPAPTPARSPSPASPVPPQRRPSPSPPPPQKRSKLDEPIQITRIDVGHIEVGDGVQVQHTTIAQPMMVAADKLDVDFPQPLEMPDLSKMDLWPQQGDQLLLPMPEPPPMPVIDWADIAPPMPPVPAIGDVWSREEDV